MEIVCKKCRHPNKMGAIFCRACGAKLELSNIDPETLRRKLNPPKFPWRKVFLALFVLAFAGLLCALFLPVGDDMPELPGQDKELTQQLASLQTEFDALLKSEKAGVLSGTPEVYSLLLTSLINPAFKVDAEPYDATPRPRIVVGLDEDGEELEVYLQTKKFGFLPCFAKLTYRNEKGKFVFSEIRIGRLDVPDVFKSIAGQGVVHCIPLAPEYRARLSDVAEAALDKNDRIVVRVKPPQRVPEEQSAPKE